MCIGAHTQHHWTLRTDVDGTCNFTRVSLDLCTRISNCNDQAPQKGKENRASCVVVKWDLGNVLGEW